MIATDKFDAWRELQQAPVIVFSPAGKLCRLIPADMNRPCKGPAFINENPGHVRIRRHGHHHVRRLGLPEAKYILKETAHHRSQKQLAEFFS